MFKKGYTPWNKGLTKFTDERVAKNAEAIKASSNKMNETRITTCLEKYGVNNVSKVDFVKEKIRLSHSSDEWKEQVRNTKKERYGSETYNNPEKNKATKQERYGDSGYNNRELFKKTCLERYGVYHYNKCKYCSMKISATRLQDNTQQKAFETIKLKYGSLSNYYRIVQDKIWKTRKKNGTLGPHSSYEISFYNGLLKRFHKDDILTQYRSDEYPFKCDFYIISKDTYIELNGMWTHGTHPYDENKEEDVSLLESYKNSSWYNTFRYTWTDLDVRKYRTGIKNDLNLVIIYPGPKGEDIVYTHLKGCGEVYSRTICSDIVQML